MNPKSCEYVTVAYFPSPQRVQISRVEDEGGIPNPSPSLKPSSSVDPPTVDRSLRHGESVEFHATVESTSEIGAEVPVQNGVDSHGMLLCLFPHQERRLPSSIARHSLQEAPCKSPILFLSLWDPILVSLLLITCYWFWEFCGSIS